MRGLWATSRNAFAEVAAKPGALGVQMLIMAINDFVWVIFWVLFFDQVGTLGGWDRDSIIVLQAVLTTAGGLSLGLFANARPSARWPSAATSTPCSRSRCRRCASCCSAASSR